MDFSFEQISSIVTMLLLISFLIITHELGHFWVAKKCGIRVERFGFGLPFGPTLWSKKFGETEYCIHAALFGGYVAFPDDNPDSEIPPDSPERFENKTVAQRFAVAIAGITVNALTGWLLMMIIIMVWGLADLEGEDVTVQMVMADNSAAAQAGLRAGDVFRKIDGQSVNNIQRDAENRVAFVRYEIAKAPNATVTLTVQQQCDTAKPPSTEGSQEPSPTSKPFISPCDPVQVSVPTGSTISLGVPLTGNSQGVVVGQVPPIATFDDTLKLRTGDRIVALEGTELSQREPNTAKQLAYVNQYLSDRPNQTLNITVERAGKPLALKATPAEQGTLPVELATTENGQVQLAQVDQTLEPQGLMVGDTVVAVNDKPVADLHRLRAERVHFVQSTIQSHPGQALAVDMERQGKPFNTLLTPNENGLIGVQLAAGKAVYTPDRNPLSASWKSLQILGNWTVKNFEALGGIFTGATDTSQLSGPIGIVTQGGQMIKENGIQHGLMITAAISVILAVMNLLPIPALDGGHILFLLIEAIKGSPVKKETQEKAVQFGFMALLALMVFVVFNDINNIANPVFKAGQQSEASADAGEKPDANPSDTTNPKAEP